MAKKLTTLEKFLKAKAEYEAKKFTSIEAAAKANKLSPASYYNYAKELKEQGAALSITPENMTDANAKEILSKFEPTPAAPESSIVATLQKRINELEKKIVDLVMAKV